MNYLLMFLIGTFQTLVLASMFRGNQNRTSISGDVGGGGNYESSKTNSSSSTTYTQTPEEKELNQMDLALRKEVQPQLIDVNKLALSLSGNLLSGQDLPGYLQGLPGGINPEVTQDIVDRSIEDVRTGFQSQGLLESGVAQEIAGRTAADIRTQAEQFNINNLLQLLNLAIGSSAQTQSPVMGFGSQLSGRLAGLRGSNTTGQSSTSKWGANANANAIIFPSMSPTVLG